MRNLRLLKKGIFYTVILILILHLVFSVSYIYLMVSQFPSHPKFYDTRCTILKKSISHTGFGPSFGSPKEQDLYSVYYNVVYKVNNSNYTSIAVYGDAPLQEAQKDVNKHEINKAYKCRYRADDPGKVVLDPGYSIWTKYIIELFVIIILIFINYYTDSLYKKKKD